MRRQLVARSQHTARIRTDVERGRPPRIRESALDRCPNITGYELLTQRFTGRNVLVLGSAPLREPLTVQRTELVVCINGSISSLVGRPPDLWLVNSRVKPLDRWGHERRFLHTTMMAQAAHRHVKIIGFMTRMAKAEDYTAAWLRELHTTWDQSVVVARTDRERIELKSGVRTPSMNRDACSAGVFGVILVLWAGAAHVRMEGFSFEKGYHYLPGHKLPENCRAHVQGDRLALRQIAATYPGQVDGVLVPGSRYQERPA